MAWVIFREQRVDVTVLEVGLGGRLDATNIVEPELCVITPVDYDHERFLGSSIESIAAEKAGILKPGVPAVIAPQRPEAELVIRAHGDKLIPSWSADHSVAYRGGSDIWTHGEPFHCGLAGRHQIVNALTAATALDSFGVPYGAIAEGLRDARWPGRLTRIQTNPEIIVDGAHNPAGARALASYVTEFYSDPKPTLIFGAMRDKSVEEMSAILFPCFSKVIVTAPNQSRALAPETFLGMVDHPDLRCAPTLREALTQVTSTTFISGSLFLVAEAMERINRGWQ
jgi:dihydrofolate synthase/folylpolyglutamate synthase